MENLIFCAVIVTVNELIHNQNHEPDFHRTPQWVRKQWEY